MSVCYHKHQSEQLMLQKNFLVKLCTFVSSFCCVHFHLKLPVLMDVEGFASSYTLKGQHFSMHTHMILKRRGIPKIFRTMFTLKRLGTSVSSLVFLKTPTIKESPITKVTPERSFSRMNLFMAPKG